MSVAVMENLGWGVYCVDAHYIRHGIACCYLLVEDGEVAIIETGAKHTPDSLRKALESLRLSPEAVRYVIPTHVHLDHAGGAGLLMQRYANAQLLIHPRGARHMINPSQLMEGAKAVYGKEKFAELYGELIPVPKQRVRKIDDGEKLYIGKRVLEFRHTPGHAEHHFSIWDELSRGWFSGDTFGISYQAMGLYSEQKKSVGASYSDRFIIPSTSPVQFDPDKLLASIDLMMSYEPERFYLTHYSVLEQPGTQANLLREQIEHYRQIGLRLKNESQREQKLFDAVKEVTLTCIRSKYPALDQLEMTELLALDFQLNAMGLDVWLNSEAFQGD